MKIIVLALFICVLFWGFSLPYTLRTYARSLADRIIYGPRPGTKKLINRCISILTWTNRWLTKDEEPDNRRIERLNRSLKKMQNPQG